MLGYSPFFLWLLGLLSGVALGGIPTDFEVSAPGIPKAAQVNIVKKLTWASHHHERLEPSLVGQALLPFGYLHPRVHIHSCIDVVGASHCQRFIVNAGARACYRQVQVRWFPEQPVSWKALGVELPKSGDPLDTNRYEELKDKIEKWAHQHGYLRMQFSEHWIHIHKKLGVADLKLTVVLGRPFYFGEVHFTSMPLNEKLLRAFIPFNTSQPFSSDQLSYLQEYLSKTPYFSRVAVRALPPEDHHVPVEVSLEPSKPYAYRLGLGFGTDTRFRSSMGVDWHHLNRRGHSASIQGQASKDEELLSLRYLIPGFAPAFDTIHFNAVFSEHQYKQGPTQKEQWGVTYHRDKGGFKNQWGLVLLQERYPLLNAPNVRRSSHYLLPFMDVLLLHGEPEWLPLFGYRVQGSVKVASKELWSESNLLQAQFKAKWMLPAPKPSRLVLQLGLGYSAGNALRELPFSLQFFTGGTETVRGYEYESLGPGRYLALGSVEWQLHLASQWYAATFYDWGNAADTWPVSLKRGLGFGLIWRSPLGPARLYYANAVDLTGHPWRIQFSLGPSL